MRRRRSRGRKRTAATLRVEALQVSCSAEPSRLTPRLRLVVRHGEHASADRPQRAGALRRPPAARESRTRTRLPRCAWRGRAGLSRSEPGPSPRAGAESRRAGPPGSGAGARRRGAVRRPSSAREAASGRRCHAARGVENARASAAPRPAVGGRSAPPRGRKSPPGSRADARGDWAAFGRVRRARQRVGDAARSEGDRKNISLRTKIRHLFGLSGEPISRLRAMSQGTGSQDKI